MERLIIRYAALISFLSITSYVVAQKTSRLRLEPTYYLGFGFSRFNSETKATTSPEFYKINPLGFSKNQDGVSSYHRSDPFHQKFAFGFIIHYGLKPNLDLDISAQVSGVGSEGFSFAGGSADAIRVVRYAVSPIYNIGFWRKQNISLHAGIGLMLDVVSKTTPQFSGGSTYGKDTIISLNTSRILNQTGISIHPNIQFKKMLENGNSFNFHITAAIGLIPLTSSDYLYIRNQEKYYTELISNGSFLRIGIGYEFQFLRNIITYPTIGTKYEHYYE